MARLRFASEEARQCQSRYEGQTINETIMSHITACGIELREDRDVDFQIVVHAAIARVITSNCLDMRICVKWTGSRGAIDAERFWKNHRCRARSSMSHMPTVLIRC